MKRRRSVNSDSSIRIKTTYDEELDFKAECEKRGETMSQIVRLALNEYLNVEIFEK